MTKVSMSWAAEQVSKASIWLMKVNCLQICFHPGTSKYSQQTVKSRHKDAVTGDD